MRLVTWNCCRGAYSTKVPLLDSLAADITVVQECARPEAESETCLWFGDNQRQGIAVQASNQYRIRALPTVAEVPKFVFPLEVVGPENFSLLAVWSKGNQTYRYVMGVVKAIETYRDKDYWNQIVFITSKDENLTKAHVKYLEGRLLEQAKQAGRALVKNGQASGARLPESDRSGNDAGNKKASIY